MMPIFWNNVVYNLNIFGPLICVLRLVNGEKKLDMGYICVCVCVPMCEMMDRATHYSSLEYFYSNKNIDQDEEVLTGLY